MYKRQIICGLIAFKIGLIDVSVKSIIMMLLPIIYNEYWFISSYLILMLLVPFLNPLLKGMSRNKHRAFIGLGLLVFSIIPVSYTHLDVYKREKYILF